MTKFCILLVEDAVVTSVALAKALQTELPDASILRAQSLFEARLLLSSYEIQFFVVDVQLPDGCGIDFLPDIISRNPSAGVVIMTSDTVPQYRDQASSFGVLNFFEKPVLPRALARIVRSYKNSVFDTAFGSETSFSGSLTRLSAIDVIQLKCLAHATMRLDFTLSDCRYGSIHLKEGCIIHAETAAHPKSEAKTGLPALGEIVSWRGGRIEEVRDPEEPAHTISGEWQALLLDAAHYADETREPRT